MTPAFEITDVEMVIRSRRSWGAVAQPAARLVRWWRVDAKLREDPLVHKSYPIGTCEIVMVNLARVADQRENALGLLTEHREGVLKVAREVLDVGGTAFVPELAEVCDIASCDELLVLDRVRVVPEWRGHGLGPLIAAHVIDMLASHRTLAACYPAPAEGEAVSGPGRGRAIDALGRTWAKVGFAPFRNDVWVLGFEVFNERYGSLTAQ